MIRCACGFEAESEAGLCSHQRSKHPQLDQTPNRAAVEMMLLALGLEDVDAARVQAARSLADAVDAEPDKAQLWRYYLDAIQDLRADGETASADDDELKEIRGLTAVGHLKAIK